MSMSAFLDFIRVDFDRSVKSLADQRGELIAERERRVRQHQAVADIDAKLKPLTHSLLAKRRRNGRRAWA